MGTGGVGEVEVELGSSHAERLHRAHHEEAAAARGQAGAHSQACPDVHRPVCHRSVTDTLGAA